MNPTNTRLHQDEAEAGPARRHTASTINDDLLEALYDQRDQLLLLALHLLSTTSKEATA